MGFMDKMNEIASNIGVQQQIITTQQINAPSTSWNILVFKCFKCGKMFNPAKGKVRYRTNVRNGLELFCDSCNAKWEKQYEIKNATFEQHGNIINAVVELKQGGKIQGSLDTVRGRSDLPPSFHDELEKRVTAWGISEVNKRLKDFRIVDTFDKQEIHCSTNGGDSYVIPFKVAIGGKLLLAPAITKNIPPFVMEQVEQRLEKE